MPNRHDLLTPASNPRHATNRSSQVSATGRLIPAQKSLGNTRLHAKLSAIQRSPASASPPLPAVPRKDSSLLAPDPRLVTDEQIYAGLDEMHQRDADELAAARKAEVRKLNEMTADWDDDESAFALSLLDGVLTDRTHLDPRAMSERTRQPILDRYAAWLRAQDAARRKRCWKMDGVVGFLVEAQRGLNPEIDYCHSWFADDDSHGPAELRSLERTLKLNRLNFSASPAEYIYWDVFELRKRTNPLMLTRAMMSSGLVNKFGAIAASMPGSRAGPRVALGEIPQPEIQNTSPVPSPREIPARPPVQEQPPQLPPGFGETAQTSAGPARATQLGPKVFRVPGTIDDCLAARLSIEGQTLVLRDVSLQAAGPAQLLNIARQLLKFAAQNRITHVRFIGFIINQDLRTTYRTSRFDVTVPATPEGLMGVTDQLTDNNPPLELQVFDPRE